jgi:hypothetical protein
MTPYSETFLWGFLVGVFFTLLTVGLWQMGRK